MSGKHILLVLSKYRASREAVEYALQKAAESQGRLTVALVLLDHETEALYETLADQGFLGHSSSRRLAEQIQQEDASAGERALEMVRRRASARGVPADTVVLRGSMARAVPAWARQHEVDRIVVTRADRGELLRKLFGSEVTELSRSPEAVVEVFRPRRGRDFDD